MRMEIQAENCTDLEKANAVMHEPMWAMANASTGIESAIAQVGRDADSRIIGLEALSKKVDTI